MHLRASQNGTNRRLDLSSDVVHPITRVMGSTSKRRLLSFFSSFVFLLATLMSSLLTELKHTDKNSAATSISSLSSVADTHAASAAQKSCDDPCHMSQCHVGHCAIVLSKNVELDLPTYKRSYGSSRLSFYVDPLKNGLRRPPRRA